MPRPLSEAASSCVCLKRLPSCTDASRRAADDPSAPQSRPSGAYASPSPPSAPCTDTSSPCGEYTTSALRSGIFVRVLKPTRVLNRYQSAMRLTARQLRKRVRLSGCRVLPRSSIFMRALKPAGVPHARLVDGLELPAHRRELQLHPSVWMPRRLSEVTFSCACLNRLACCTQGWWTGWNYPLIDRQCIRRDV